MGRIQRDWLNRIPDYHWVRNPARRPAAGGEPLPPPLPGDGEEAGAESTPLEDSEQQSTGDPPRDQEPREGDPSDGGEEQTDGGEEQTAGGELSLEVPPEVEERRREDERKRRRSAVNLGLAPKAFELEGHYLRNLATRFARMISKVAEDSADLPAPGDDEWDFAELIKRRFTGRNINQCRMTREKRKVAVVLDTSPSCEHQARLFGSIARIAEELGDCDLYDAPNFVITARKTAGEWEPLPEAAREWDFTGRVVLAFGDFDGIERICQASAVRGNRIFWFCCEERPQVLELQRDQFVKGYKGKYFPATTLQQLMRAIARVR